MSEVIHTPRNLETATICGMPQDEFLALAKSIAIILPHRVSEGLNPGLAENIGPWKQVDTFVRPLEDQFGGFIELTRAGIAREFLALCQQLPHIDKLVMIDSDENMSWEAPYRLAAWDMPVVSGVVCSYHDKRGIYACFTVKDKYGTPRFPSTKHTKILPRRGLMKVWNVGTGLICIKKNVLEAISEAGEIPFYVPEKLRLSAAATGTLKYGEDMAFTQQCEKLGFERYVDLSVHAAHYKVTPICWPQNDEHIKDIDPDDWHVDVKDYFHG